MGPKLTVNAICCSSVSCWPGKTSTAYLSMPASIAATSCWRQRLGDVDAGDLAGDCGSERADGEGHGRSSHRWALSHYPFRPRPRQPFPQCALRNAGKRRPRPTALLHQRRCLVGGGNAAPQPDTTRACLTRRGPAPRQSDACARVDARCLALAWPADAEGHVRAEALALGGEPRRGVRGRLRVGRGDDQLGLAVLVGPLVRRASSRSRPTIPRHP